MSDRQGIWVVCLWSVPEYIPPPLGSPAVWHSYDTVYSHALSQFALTLLGCLEKSLTSVSVLGDSDVPPGSPRSESPQVEVG